MAIAWPSHDPHNCTLMVSLARSVVAGVAGDDAETRTPSAPTASAAANTSAAEALSVGARRSKEMLEESRRRQLGDGDGAGGSSERDAAILQSARQVQASRSNPTRSPPQPTSLGDTWFVHPPRTDTWPPRTDTWPPRTDTWQADASLFRLDPTLALTASWEHTLKAGRALKSGDAAAAATAAAAARAAAKHERVLRERGASVRWAPARSRRRR